MSWNTIYITGKPGFIEQVSKRLEDSDFPCMPGNLGNDQDISLFWIDDKLALRDFKQAIGSRVVFKYRLQFFNSLEELQRRQDQHTSLSAREESMIQEMREQQQKQNYRLSA